MTRLITILALVAVIAVVGIVAGGGCEGAKARFQVAGNKILKQIDKALDCLLYTSPSPRDRQKSRMPSSA